MKWVKRGLWLAAWGTWAWCGVRLLHELPRDRGREIGRLAFEDDDRVLGFLEGGELVLTEANLPGGKRRHRVSEARTGRIHLDTESLPAPYAGGGVMQPVVSARQGVAIGLVAVEGARSTSGLSLLDFRTGARRTIAPPSADVLAIDDERPWAALSVGPDEGRELVVVDMRSGNTVYRWADPHPVTHGQRVDGCQFLNGDELVVVTRASIDFARSLDHYEVIHLSISRGEVARRSVERETFSAHLPLRNGRFLLLGAGSDGNAIEVEEFSSGRIVFNSEATPPKFHEPGRSDWDPFPVLSLSGRRMLTRQATLWSLDDCRLLWQPGPTDAYVAPDSTLAGFAVSEDWSSLGPWARDIETWAFRDVETGAVIRRYWGGAELSCVSTDGHWAIAKDGVVYEEPLHVNYPLLALCQAILALPLVLLWAALQWRRKRRMRLAGVVST